MVPEQGLFCLVQNHVFAASYFSPDKIEVVQQNAGLLVNTMHKRIVPHQYLCRYANRLPHHWPGHCRHHAFVGPAQSRKNLFGAG